MRKISRIIGINLLIGIGVFFAVGSLLNDGEFLFGEEMLIQFAFVELYTVVIGGSNMLLFDFLNSRKWKKPNMRVVIAVFASFMITSLELFLLQLTKGVFYENLSLLQFLQQESASTYVFTATVTIVVVLGINLFQVYKTRQEKRVKESELVAKTVTAKFESLKSQLDPHFLFNSLNVLTSLIGEDPERAEEFTTKLSRVYRYVLEQKSKDLISIREELQFANHYMDLIMMRFEDAITYNVKYDNDQLDEFKIVPLTLQLLLENCIKHNRIPMDIEIAILGDSVVVRNSYRPKETVSKGTKVGLDNIKKRYAIISKRPVEVIQNSEEFKVIIPLLIQESRTMNIDEYKLKDQEKFYRARARVKEMREFYSSVVSFIVIIPFLAYINYVTYWGVQWFWFAAGGWGLGLTIQGLKVFGIGSNWEARQIKKYMNEKDY